MTRGAYPGSFNPCTIAHLAVADAARDQLGLATLHLVLSFDALGKDSAGVPTPDARMAAIRDATGNRSWLEAVVTSKRYLADIGADYDWLVLGADKWAQLLDASWFASPAEWAASLIGLRGVAVAPRPPDPTPTAEDLAMLRERLGDRCPEVVVLRVDASLAEVSATAVRAGRADWRA